MKKSKKYLINPDLKIVKKYHDKTGLKIYIFEQPMTISGVSFTNLLLEVYEDKDYFGFIESGWPVDRDEIYEYIRCVELFIFRKKRPHWKKLQKRRLLRIIREFPLHPGTTYGDFLYQDGRVNWDKVEEYETNHKQQHE
jgi:hypothetical protein